MKLSWGSRKFLSCYVSRHDLYDLSLISLVSFWCLLCCIKDMKDHWSATVSISLWWVFPNPEQTALQGRRCLTFSCREMPRAATAQPRVPRPPQVRGVGIHVPQSRANDSATVIQLNVHLCLHEFSLKCWNVTQTVVGKAQNRVRLYLLWSFIPISDRIHQHRSKHSADVVCVASISLRVSTVNCCNVLTVLDTLDLFPN